MKKSFGQTFWIPWSGAAGSYFLWADGPLGLAQKPKLQMVSGGSSTQSDSFQDFLLRLASSIELPMQGLRGFKMLAPTAPATPSATPPVQTAPQLALEAPPVSMAISSTSEKMKLEETQSVSEGPGALLSQPEAAIGRKHSPVEAAKLLQKELADARGDSSANAKDVDSDQVAPARKPKAKAQPKQAAPKAKTKITKKIAPKAKAKAVASTGTHRVNLVNDRKTRLAAGITPALLRKHKHGCPTCRSRPLCCISCWQKRGYRF